MSQTTPRKHPNASSYSPHSHAPRHHHQQQQQYQNAQAQYAHSRTRSQQLRAQAAVDQHFAAANNTSDYESDTAHYMAAHPGPSQAALAARTNTELNLGVLRRYRPDVSSILSIAANAVVYVFNTTSKKWDKANLEGTLFICAQQRQQDDFSTRTDTNGNSNSDDDDEGTADGLLFILNRKNLTNLTLDLRAVANYELATDLLIFQLDEDEDAVVVPMENREPMRPKVLGLWIHAESDQDRSTSSALIYELWTKARAAAADDRDEQTEQEETTQDETTSASQSSASPAEGAGAGTAPHVGGRQVTLNELFGRSQNGYGAA
ncbi:PH domain-like protein [Hypoxylon rubiginosum]|uniref:PH domain-like protein n=1 Tax=Hypoxylon rubiginosum TaxID=110542 RepID=A0ACC0DLI6_9PEZI|nr:PH domain-like protein [Hypoxylon rubiginosum]